jgi:hypothetical protein
MDVSELVMRRFYAMHVRGVRIDEEVLAHVALD